MLFKKKHLQLLCNQRCDAKCNGVCQESKRGLIFCHPGESLRLATYVGQPFFWLHWAIPMDYWWLYVLAWPLRTAASLCGCIIQELFLSPVAALEINVSFGSTWESWRAEARTHALLKKETVTAEFLCSCLVVFLIRIPFIFFGHTALFRSSESSRHFLIEFPKPLGVATPKSPSAMKVALRDPKWLQVWLHP